MQDALSAAVEAAENRNRQDQLDEAERSSQRANTDCELAAWSGVANYGYPMRVAIGKPRPSAYYQGYGEAVCNLAKYLDAAGVLEAVRQLAGSPNVNDEGRLAILLIDAATNGMPAPIAEKLEKLNLDGPDEPNGSRRLGAWLRHDLRTLHLGFGPESLELCNQPPGTKTEWKGSWAPTYLPNGEVGPPPAIAAIAILPATTGQRRSGIPLPEQLVRTPEMNESAKDDAWSNSQAARPDQGSIASTRGKELLANDGIKVNHGGFELWGKPYPLQPKQQEVLAELLKNYGSYVLRTALENKIWGSDPVTPGAVTKQINLLSAALKKALKKAGHKGFERIESVGRSQSLAYRLTLPKQPAAKIH